MSEQIRIYPTHVLKIKDKELDRNCRYLLMALIDLQHLKEIYQSNRTFGEKLRMGETTVSKTFGKLEKLGYIHPRTGKSLFNTRVTLLNRNKILTEIFRDLHQVEYENLSKYYKISPFPNKFKSNRQRDLELVRENVQVLAN